MNKKIFLVLLVVLMGVANVIAQQKFRISEFALDAFDMTARNDQYKKVDGSGSLYAIIKVSGEEGDNLREYQFNFGNMNHLIEERDGLLWVYVQKNAKRVTIRRNGYTPLLNYDLQTTIEEGKTYRMHLTAQGPVIYTQMVMFQTEPKVAGAVVMVQREGGDRSKELFGTTDVTGVAAKGLEFGTYTYEVMAENYYSTEGRFTLNSQTETHREDVMLRSNGANITLAVASNADIYINGTKKGTRTWTGSLKAGLHSVECRQANHRPSSQTISVKEGEDQSIVLTPPTPITGVLAITSSPSGATINVDGKGYGTTPRNITNLLIGEHKVKLSLNGYGEAQTTVDIKEQQTTDVNLALKEQDKTVTPSDGSESTVSDDDLTQINIIYSNGILIVDDVRYNMVHVEGGTFPMGYGNDKSNENPAHSVTLSSYKIGQTEVTQALWRAVMGKNPSFFRGASLPVENVSWEDCQEFIRRLNLLTGQKFRLPTEAEWEFAARGGTKSKGYKYSGSNSLSKIAWYNKNSEGNTHPVATQQPNELGLYDMTGNVWEWCQDWKGPYSSVSVINPTGPETGSFRVDRGGSWSSMATFCPVAYRSHHAPLNSNDYIGLRLALSAE